MRHLFALFCCILLVCRTAPLLAQTSEEPEAPAPSVLALEGWVQSFREADPVLREAALRTALAALAVEQSGTPQHTDLSLAAGASADIWAWSSGGEPIPQAHIDLDSVRLSAQNRLGQRWEVTGSGRIGVPGSIGLGGSSAALGGAFYASVLGNHQGKLHVLESRYLSLDRDAAGTRQSDVERQRCWLATELYVVAWSLQEQVRLFSELMETRQQNVQQTERDYRRGMVPRLDLLTAQSDVLGAQGEQQALTARLERALAALASFLETTPDRLLAPGAALEEMLPTTEESGWLPLEQHPSYLAWAHDEAARRAETDWIDQRYMPQLELGPELGLRSRSHALGPQGDEAHLVDFEAGMGVRLSLPVSAPMRALEQRGLQERAELARARQEEALRSLRERRDQAVTAIDSARGQSTLVVAQLLLMEQQISEAWRMFQDGRIEYQDYLLHYAQFERVSLRAIELQLIDWQGGIELADLVAPLPEMCQ